MIKKLFKWMDTNRVLTAIIIGAPSSKGTFPRYYLEQLIAASALTLV